MSTTVDTVGTHDALFGREAAMLRLVDERTLRIIEARRSAGVPRRRGWLIRRLLLSADIVGLTLAFLLAEAVLGEGPGGYVSLGAELTLFLLTLPCWIVLAKMYGLYDRDVTRAVHSTVDDVSRVVHVLTVGTLFFAFAGIGLELGHPNLGEILTFWLLAFAAVTTARAAARAIARRRVEYIQNTVIVGAGDVGQMIARKFLQHPEYGINVVGFVDAEPKERQDDLGHLALLGGPGRLPSLVRMLDVERVVIAFSNEGHAEALGLIRSLKDLHVQIDIVPRLFDMIGAGVHLHTVEGMPLVGLAPPQLTPSSRLVKRLLDLTVSAVVLTALSPLFLLVMLAVKLDSRGPVFFRQTRAGEHGQTFTMLKFRTMVDDADDCKHEFAHLNRHLRPGGDPRMFKIENDPRVTRFGQILRRYFVDELPQLVNVVRGEMSLIGPRPLILEEAAHVDDWQQRRLDLKPGMTGLWQVLGRSSISFEEMVKLDYLYVTTWSLAQDLKLLFQTIPLVFRGESRV